MATAILFTILISLSFQQNINCVPIPENVLHLELQRLLDYLLSVQDESSEIFDTTFAKIEEIETNFEERADKLIGGIYESNDPTATACMNEVLETISIPDYFNDVRTLSDNYKEALDEIREKSKNVMAGTAKYVENFAGLSLSEKFDVIKVMNAEIKVEKESVENALENFKLLSVEFVEIATEIFDGLYNKFNVC